MDTATYNHLQRLMRISRDCGVSAADRRDNAGAFTAYCLLACAKAEATIRAQGYYLDCVEVGADHMEMIAWIHGTPVVAVSL